LHVDSNTGELCVVHVSTQHRSTSNIVIQLNILSGQL
jgi:hypothetical protein